MRYRAFFSYARADDRIANWLHRQLDIYRTPKELVGTEGALGPVPVKLHPIFRDRTDMSGGGQLSDRIEEALKESEALIILCSPATAASPWVNREVELFLASGQRDRIFPVIAAGLPESNDLERDFFPPALRGLGVLAADLREIRQSSGRMIGDGREGGRLKLLAGLLGLGLDQLTRRERRRQRLLLAGTSAAALSFACVAVAAGWFAYDASQARDSAYAALGRGFVEKSWDAVADGDHLLGVKYALSGMTAAPRYAPDFRALMARLAYDLWDKAYLSTPDDPLLEFEVSNDGSMIALRFRDRCEVRDIELRLFGTLSACEREGTNIVAIRRDGDNIRLLLQQGDGLPIRGNHIREVDLYDARTAERIGGTALSYTFGATPLSEDGHLVGFLTETGFEIRDLQTAQSWRVDGPAHSVETSPDGSYFAVTLGSSATQRVQVWDTARRRLLFERADLHPVCLSAETIALVARDGGSYRVFNLPNGALRNQFSATAHDLGIDCQPFSLAALPEREAGDRRVLSRDGRLAVLFNIEFPQDPLASMPDTLRPSVWMQDGRRLQTLRGHSGPLGYSHDVAFLSRGILSRDIRGIGILHRTIVADAAFHSDIWPMGDAIGGYEGQLIFASASGRHFNPALPFSGAGNRVLRVLAPRDAPPRQLPEIADGENILLSTAISPDGENIAAGTQSGLVRIWDQATGRFVRSADTSLGAIERLFYLHDGNRLIAADSAGAVSIIDTRNGAELFESSVPKGEEIGPGDFLSSRIWDDGNESNLTITRDGALIASALDSRDITITEVATGTRRTLSTPARIGGLEFSPDGTTLYSGHQDGLVRVWDVETWTHRGTFASALRVPIYSVAVSESGRLVASGDYGGLVRLWDDATGRALIHFQDHAQRVHTLAFSTDGSLLLSLDADSVFHMRSIPGLDLPLEALAERLCRALTNGHARRFSSDEIAADPAISEIWTRGGQQRALCE